MKKLMPYAVNNFSYQFLGEIEEKNRIYHWYYEGDEPDDELAGKIWWVGCARCSFFLRYGMSGEGKDRCDKLMQEHYFEHHGDFMVMKLLAGAVWIKEL